MARLPFVRRIALLAAFASCAAGAADDAKVLRLALLHEESTFDPAMVSEVYSLAIVTAIMEPLLAYDYLARPAKLVPLTAAGLPELSDDGRTYTFRLKPGLRYADDPAFQGVPRELTAGDYAYAIKRLVDPALRSPNAFQVAGKIVGLDAAAEAAARPNARFDYDAPIAGLEVVDPLTLRIRLTRSDRKFAYVMAAPALSAVAREAVNFYGGAIGAHPIGTGPYRLKSWLRASRITLEANPAFRHVVWDLEPGADPRDREIARTMRGKRLPAIGTLEFIVLEEAQAQLLAFEGGEIDIGDIPAVLAPRALRGEKLAPDLAARGVQLSRLLEQNITYTAFNMRDPVVGGFARHRIALRRAIAMAYSNEVEIAVARNRQAVPLEMPIPPGVPGHSAAFRSLVRHDSALANKLLDETGYRRGPGGWRIQPDGRPLVLRYATQRTTDGRANAELWKRAFDAIGIRVAIDEGTYADQIKAATQCRHQLWSYGWAADYPDGDNFMQLLYGPNIHQTNVACYASAEYDALYRESQRLPDSAARTALYERMTRQADADAPWRLHVAPYRNVITQPWVVGHKPHPLPVGEFLYVDIDRRTR